MARFCNKCHYPIEEGGNFCTECGSSDISDTSGQPINPSNEMTINTNISTPEAIPEVGDVPSNSFGDQTISNLQSSTIKPISTGGDTPSTAAPTVEVPASSNTFVEVPSHFLSTPDVPKGFGVDIDPTQPVDMQNTINNQVFNVGPAPKKKSFPIIIIVFLVILALGIGGFIILQIGKGLGSSEMAPFQEAELNTGEVEDPTVDNSIVFTPENSFRVGDPSFGYISIPNTWSQITPTEGDYSLKFTDDVWVVVLYSTSTSKQTAADYSNEIYKSIHDAGAQNIKTGKSKIAGYNAFTITAYYSSYHKYLTTWVFESSLGRTHYLAIEGPTEKSDNFNIIYSFNESK